MTTEMYSPSQFLAEELTRRAARVLIKSDGSDMYSNAEVLWRTEENIAPIHVTTQNLPVSPKDATKMAVTLSVETGATEQESLNRRRFTMLGNWRVDILLPIGMDLSNPSIEPTGIKPYDLSCRICDSVVENSDISSLSIAKQTETRRFIRHLTLMPPSVREIGRYPNERDRFILSVITQYRLFVIQPRQTYTMIC